MCPLRSEGNLGLSCGTFCLSFWDRIFHWPRTHQVGLHWLSSQSWGSACLSFSSLDYKCATTPSFFLCKVVRVKLRSLYFTTTLLSYPPSAIVPDSFPQGLLEWLYHQCHVALNLSPASLLLSWLKSSRDAKQDQKHLRVVGPLSIQFSGGWCREITTSNRVNPSWAKKRGLDSIKTKKD